MSAEFEKQKNARALAWTLAVGSAVFLMVWLISWSNPPKVVPNTEEYIEINLGNSDMGSGTDQPELPGDPAPAQQMAYTPPTPTQSHEESVRDVADEHESAPEAPVVTKPAVSRPDATKIAESKTVKTNNPVPQPPVEARRVPKAVAGRTLGGTGNGGNGAETYRPGNGEGSGNGPGDQGVVGGNPNGTRYSGVVIRRGLQGRSITKMPSLFGGTIKGKVILNITVDASGKVIEASRSADSPVTDREAVNFAIQKAYELRFNSGQQQTGAITFNFDYGS